MNATLIVLGELPGWDMARRGDQGESGGQRNFALEQANFSLTGGSRDEATARPADSLLLPAGRVKKRSPTKGETATKHWNEGASIAFLCFRGRSEGTHMAGSRAGGL